VKRLQPTFPLRYTFLDENINRFYKSEAKWSTIFEWAGGISIFLACLGLFGLAALSAANRTLEIGIRKILGADLPSIVYVLSGDFLKIVCIAFLVASPLAWYFLHKWLEAYPYRVQIGWGIFAFTGLGVILIALLTVGYQAIRTGMANPVKSLRTE
jgi:putative ABC transport system permease protein